MSMWDRVWRMFDRRRWDEPPSPDSFALDRDQSVAGGSASLRLEWLRGEEAEAERALWAARVGGRAEWEPAEQHLAETTLAREEAERDLAEHDRGRSSVDGEQAGFGDMTVAERPTDETAGRLDRSRREVEQLDDLSGRDDDARPDSCGDAVSSAHEAVEQMRTQQPITAVPQHDLMEQIARCADAVNDDSTADGWDRGEL
jgi:hypothetical protein